MVLWPGGRIWLAPLCIKTLAFLVDNYGTVVNHAQVYQHIYGTLVRDKTAARVLVSRTKRRLEAANAPARIVVRIKRGWEVVRV